MLNNLLYKAYDVTADLIDVQTFNAHENLELQYQYFAKYKFNWRILFHPKELLRIFIGWIITSVIIMPVNLLGYRKSIITDKLPMLISESGYTTRYIWMLSNDQVDTNNIVLPYSERKITIMLAGNYYNFTINNLEQMKKNRPQMDIANIHHPKNAVSALAEIECGITLIKQLVKKGYKVSNISIIAHSFGAGIAAQIIHQMNKNLSQGIQEKFALLICHHSFSSFEYVMMDYINITSNLVLLKYIQWSLDTQNILTNLAVSKIQVIDSYPDAFMNMARIELPESELLSYYIDSFNHEDLSFFYDPQIPARGFAGLVNILQTFNMRAVLFILNSINNINLVRYNRSILMLIVELNDKRILQQLLKHKYLNVNITNTDGETALMFAVKTGDLYLILLLLNHKIDVNIVNNDGKTAFMLAQDIKSDDQEEILAVIKAKLVTAQE